MDLIDNYNKDSKKVKPCENGCGRLIYWNSNENAYFGFESGQKHICADQDPFIRKSQEQILRQPEDAGSANDNKYIVDLKLTSELRQTGTVNRFAFYKKTNAIQVLLNHRYNGKSIVFSVDKKDWNKTHSIFEKQLRQRDISKEHIALLSDVLDDNYHVILGLALDSDNDDDYTSSGHSQIRTRITTINQELHEDEDQKESAAQVALRLADEYCSALFMDQFGTPYAAVRIGEHIETLSLKSSRFKNWLCHIYYNSENNVLNSEALSNVINVLKAKAEFDGNSKSLGIRVTTNVNELSFSIYYDLTNKDWQVIKITKDGWSVEDAPVIFKRYSNQQPQVYPCKSKEYPPDIFDRFMKLINVKGEDNQLLLKCYIISLFYPEIPKPILMLHGEQGSAKSTLQELIRMLVDPSSIRTLTFPRDISELVQKLSHNYIAYFDNVSLIPEWISNQLCRAVTGSGFSKRELYTDDDDIIYNFKRCIGFNGINLGATKADLLDRGIIIELERIPREKERRLEEIWTEFDSVKPELLGYIFDILVRALQVKSSGGIADQINGLPRMADFAEIGEIISRCMGYDNNKFLDAYYRNIDLQVEEAIAANPVAMVITKFIENKQEWEGTATELLAELEGVAIELKINTRHKSWPKAPNTLSRRINEVKTNLREVGITIDRHFLDHKTKARGRGIKICKVSSEPSEPSETENHAQVLGGFSDDANRQTDDISSEYKISSDKTTKNHTQNDTGNDSDDGNDILHTLLGLPSDYPSICYYCDYKPNSKDDYEAHIVLGHSHSPAYPNKAEIEKRWLKAQGKDWER
jgi:hypothetical protein